MIKGLERIEKGWCEKNGEKKDEKRIKCLKVLKNG
jgi:hypothetical protein